jgi:hypothetical protein
LNVESTHLSGLSSTFAPRPEQSVQYGLAQQTGWTLAPVDSYSHPRALGDRRAGQNAKRAGFNTGSLLDFLGSSIN